MMTEDSFDLDLTLDDVIDEGLDLLDEDEWDFDSDPFIQHQRGYHDGYDTGQADVALDILTTVGDDLAIQTMQHVANINGWALAVVTDAEARQVWVEERGETPMNSEFIDWATESFWEVYVEGELKMAAEDALRDLLAVEPGDEEGELLAEGEEEFASSEDVVEPAAL